MGPSWCTFEGIILVVFSPPFFDLNSPPKQRPACNNLLASSQRSAPSQALKAALYMMMLDRILRGGQRLKGHWALCLCGGLTIYL